LRPIADGAAQAKIPKPPRTRHPADGELKIDEQYDSLLLHSRWPDTSAKLRVTDIRFYDVNGAIDRGIVRNVNGRLRQGTNVYVMVGLAHRDARQAQRPLDPLGASQRPVPRGPAGLGHPLRPRAAAPAQRWSIHSVPRIAE
jgi:hypothetical protein